MQAGAITDYFDVAQIVLYVFWIFFFGLVLYIHRESKLDGGFPMVPDRDDRSRGRDNIQGFPRMPPPRQRFLTHGAPKVPAPERPIAAEPTGAVLRRWRAEDRAVARCQGLLGGDRGPGPARHAGGGRRPPGGRDRRRCVD